MREIALIGAMESEIHSYRKLLQNSETVHDGNFTFIDGEFCGKHIILACCGPGKVLTALTTQRIIDRYHPQAMIMIGVAGALKSELRLGDVVVSKDCVQHDMDVTALGFPRGAVPDTDYRFIQADTHLIALAMKTPLHSHQLVTGRIVTGDQFLSEEETLSRSYLFEELQGYVIEMEGAALALVCAFNQIPFVIIRTVCSEFEGSQEMQYRSSLPSVVDNALLVVEAILLAL